MNILCEKNVLAAALSLAHCRTSREYCLKQESRDWY
jgi:hypothetical protein